MRLSSLFAVVVTTAFTAPAAANVQLRNTSDYESAHALRATLDDLVASNTDIDEMAVGPTGAWIIVAGNGIYKSASVPMSMVDLIRTHLNAGRDIEAVLLGAHGNFAVAAGGLFNRTSNLPQVDLLTSVVKGHQNAGRRIDELVLTPAGGFVVLAGGHYYGQNVPTALWDAIRDSDKSKRRVRRISIGADGRWILLAEQWMAGSGLSPQQRSSYEGWQRMERGTDHVMLGVGDDFVYFSHQNVVLKPPAAMAALEYGLVDQAGVTRNIWARMDQLGVPGVSVAVIDGRQIKWARGYGELEGDSERFVRASSPYSIASMSKYITALGAMRMRKRGQIQLGTDAQMMATNPNNPGWFNMQTWRTIGMQRFGTDLPSGITLSRLLSHTAAMHDNITSDANNINDGWGGMLGATEYNTAFILGGYACDPDCGFTKRTWWNPIYGVPGTRYVYSNVGYEVVRGMMEDLRGQPFQEIMQQEVLTPLGMTNTSYDVLDPAFETRAAPGLSGSKAALTRKTYQWYAGGGVYTTPEDYAKAMMVLIDQSGSASFLDEVDTALMMTDPIVGDAPVRYGFGIQLDRTQVTQSSGTFAHGGLIPSYAWSRMFGMPSRGTGVVILTNDTSDAGKTLVCELENAFRVQNGLTASNCWPQ